MVRTVWGIALTAICTFFASPALPALPAIDAPLVSGPISWIGEEGYERKVCKKGKPCGNTCININYTCHIGGGTSTTYTPPPPVTPPPVTPPPLVVTPTTPPETATKPRPTACTQATVTSIIDGDTISVRTATGTERVRISQIDAPEKSQKYGRDATYCLSQILDGASVSICRDGLDRYGRTIANLTADGTDVGAQMVAQGCAWAYTKYLEAGSDLPALQESARQAGLGLWAQGAATAPWDYRHGTVPVTVNTQGTPVIQVSTTTTASASARVFDWAEHAYPDLLRNGSATQILPDGMEYRCYDSNFCISYKSGQFYTYDGQIRAVGSETELVGEAARAGF